MEGIQCVFDFDLIFLIWFLNVYTHSRTRTHFQEQVRKVEAVCAVAPSPQLRWQLSKLKGDLDAKKADFAKKKSKRKKRKSFWKRIL